MQKKTFLELVNDAMAESKVSLDPLTSANFASPPRTAMYNHFKRWVNRAYKDLLLKRNEWFMRQERATITIYPRLQLVMLAGTLAAGDVLEGNSSGTSFKVLAIHTTEDVELDATIEHTVSVEYVDGKDTADNLILNENVSRVTPTILTDIARIKGRGRYSFSELVPYVDEVDQTSFTIQDAVAFDSTPSPTEQSVVPVLSYSPWESWRGYYELFGTATGKPYIITRADDGLWDFYPRPNEPFDISFSYSQDVGTMVAYNDVPQLLPPKFGDLIMWMAVADYADFDERPKVYARAKKHINEYNFMMDRDQLPRVGLDLYRFDG